MKLIRNSVFETNSSSCHSLSVGQSNVYMGLSPDETGTIYVEGMEFGWGQDTYLDVGSRLSYAYIYARDWGRSNSDSYIELFEKVVKEHTGAEHIEYSQNTSYIDHQSVEGGELDYIFDDPTKLKSFLFDSASWIETDNDNH